MIRPNAISAEASYLRQEYEVQKTLFETQPVILQRFLEVQGKQIAKALINKDFSAQFSLPDRIFPQQNSDNNEISPLLIPEKNREQSFHSLSNSLTGRKVQDEIIQRLNELEQSPDKGIAISAGLLRYAASVHLISRMLPAGHTVTYLPVGDEEIPTVPAQNETPDSAITQSSDAIVEDGPTDTSRGEVQVPYVPAARRFYLPQWVALDENGRLLVGSINEAEGYLKSMQRYVTILHRAVSLSAYMVASTEYQRKRYGILGQLINQGRAIANYRTKEIIQKIKDRAGKQDLNRGLSIDMPFFNDQTLKMDNYHIEIIPAGRIMFVPAFVVRASHREQAKVAQDTRLNPSTRRHLLEQLVLIETAFKSTN